MSKGYSGEKGVSPGPAPTPFIKSHMSPGKGPGKAKSPKMTQSINYTTKAK